MNVARHQLVQERITEAAEGVSGRVLDHWYTLRYGRLAIGTVREMGEVLLDHLGALSLEEGALGGARAGAALDTAAECFHGVLSLGCFPRGDFEVPFPLIDETLSSEELRFDTIDFAPTAATWVDAFALVVISGQIGERRRMLGPLLKDDYAPSVRKGLPWSDIHSTSEPAELAEMDALCDYLDVVETAVSPWVAPGPLPLRKPDAAERGAAAAALDAAGALTPDQRLLRVLLDDDQPAFERALVARLDLHRETTPETAPARSLLPVGPITLAALAVQAHGWQLGVSSGYLPAALIRPQEAQAAQEPRQA
ncbi:immunity 49 family protein [Kitasatospora sp. NPDC004745]|uniref:immunity 49 family protein n=1 Tax=unclassified Kitasatospora TaxID=2633591 RepID=UPI0036789D15